MEKKKEQHNNISSSDISLSEILVRPRITEKSNMLTGYNAYTFLVAPRANKTLIKKAVLKVYKIKPLRVAILPVPKKKINVRGRIGTRGGGKRAIVYLRPGDKIDLV